MSTAEFNYSVYAHSSNLKPYAINLTKDIVNANDLLQETFLRAIANREKFNEGTNLKAWLFTIMRNIFINDYRRRTKRKTILDQTENQFLLNSREHTVPNRATATFVLEDIQRALKKLSDDYKIPFMMHFNGYKYQEIADDLQLPLGTVKSRIFFARKELKERLSIYAPGRA